VENLVPYVQTGGALGAFGLLAWLVRRVFTHTIPRLAKGYEDSLKDVQDRFYEELRMSRADFKEELRAQREDFKEQIKLERDTFCAQLEKMTAAIKSLEDTIRRRS